MRLLAMSTLIPEQICDVVRFTGYAGERGISHYCGYASDFISMVQREGHIDGAVFPKSCDSSRIIKSYLEGSGKFLYQLNIPARRDAAAIEFLAAQLKHYKAAVEEHFRIAITDVAERIQAVNERNKELRKVYGALAELSYSEYLQALHEMLQQPLFHQKMKTDFSKKAAGGKRVFLVGSFLTNINIAKKIEDCGMAVVGDDLPESGRLCSTPDADPCGDLYLETAACVLKRKQSPTMNDFQGILKDDAAQLTAKGIKGVIFVTQKYCEPYDYLYFVYKKMLEEMGIPALKIVLADSQDEKRAGLAIEAFADTL